MASILYAWEFGANIGHVGAFMSLARALRDQGHEVHWMVTQPAVVGDFLDSQGFSWLAAPSIPEVVRQGPPLTYADILLRFGYADPRALFGLVGGWREAIRLTGASLVLADHAPTALLAAIRRGELVVVYPEGGLTRDPAYWPMRGKTGVVRIALATRAPVPWRSISAIVSALMRRRMISLRIAFMCMAMNSTVKPTAMTSNGHRIEGWIAEPPRRITLAG